MGSSERPAIRGRGAGYQTENPYLSVQLTDDLEHVAADEDYLQSLERPPTVYYDDLSQTIVATNDSPDVGFTYSINPYRGCAHGCSYCYARPTHEYLGLSAGIDFETKVMVKRRAPELLREFLGRPGWTAEGIAMSGVTDCYQPIERTLRITRGILEVAAECRQPMGLVTKNALVTRDVDLLQQLAAHNAVHVALSVTSLDQSLTRVMELRTSNPLARLRAIEELSKAGVPVIVLVAPIIPGINDVEVASILRAASDAGARAAGFTIVRLPTSVRPIFRDWLRTHRPNAVAKVESTIRGMREGKFNRSEFGKRMGGEGPIADQIVQSFKVFKKKYGLDQKMPAFNREDFRPPRPTSGQMPLF